MIAVALPALVFSALVLVLVLGARRPSGVELVIEDDALVVRIPGKDAFYALCRRLRLPLASIKGVAVGPRSVIPQTGLRLPGTGIPGMLRAGSYGIGSSRDFWLVRRAEQFLVIELEPGGPYRRVVLEVLDPHAEVLRLRPALGAYTGTFAG